MKSIFLYITFSLLCTSLFAQTTYEPNVVIVKFERTFVENELEPVFAHPHARKTLPMFKSSRANSLNRKHAVVNYSRVFGVDPRFTERHKAFDLDLFYRVEYATNEDPIDVAQSFSNDESVLIAEPSPVHTSNGKPNDPNYSIQWGLSNATYPGMDINVETAWEITTGDPRVVVAIIDDCTDPNHEDLRDNLWVNLGEIPDNGVDDDGNGKIDDINGWNFMDRNGTIKPTSADESHGTHVAGIVAARTGNNRGVAGVAGGWGSAKGASLMLFRAGSKGKVPEAYDALRYAADNGAAIAQCSWGEEDNSQAGQRAITYFTANGGGEVMTGGLIIASAGNDGSDEKQYPAADARVLSVGWIDKDGKRASHSNYGSWVDICAPGSDIYSSVPFTNKYEMMDGTSMSTPMVSGVAALVLSAAINMPLEQKTPAWLKQHLLNTAYNYAPNNQMGPLVDAGRAVEVLAASIKPSVVEPVTSVFPNPAVEQITIQNTSSETTLNYTLFTISGEIVYQKQKPQQEETVEVGAFPKGIYMLQVETNKGFYMQKIIKN